MHEILSLPIYSQICVMSDLSSSKTGTITSGEDRFMEWKSKHAIITDGEGELFGIAVSLLSAGMYVFMAICDKKAKDVVGLENSTLQITIAFLTVAVFVGTK